MLNTVAVEIIVEKDPGNWVSVRYGYLTLGATLIAKPAKLPGDYFFKPTVSIKKFILFQTGDDEDMEAEAGAIIGVANLMLKKKLTNYTISTTNHTSLSLKNVYGPCNFVDPHKLDLAIVPGFFDLTLHELAPEIARGLCQESGDLVENLAPLSKGFYEAEQKNMKKHHMRQEILKRKAAQAKAEDL